MSSMIRDSSRIVEMKARMKPEREPASVSGRMIRRNRCSQFAPAIIPASSSSPATCIIEEIPDRAEKGRFFATQTRTSSKKVP